MSRQLPTLLFVLAAVTSLVTICGQSSADASQWKGKSPGCSVQLPSSSGLKSYATFNTCPPKRVLLVGDSVALTMGIEMAWHEQNWGALVDDAALNGCGFITGGRLDVTGSFVAINSHCNTEGAQWVADVKSFKPQAIVIEMGWWDSQEHQVNGAVASLGQSGYDSELQQQMVGLVHLLQGATAAPIFLLSVPWMDPPAWPNGQTDPGASAADHTEINSLLATTAESAPSVHFIDVSKYLTPSGQFEANVGGQPCRDSDGVHLDYQVYTHCGAALAGGVLSTVRQALKTAKS